MSLQGKKILFIGIGFYDYETAIREALKCRGAVVTYFNSAVRPYYARLLMRLRMTAAARYFLRQATRKKIKRLPGGYDIIFLLKGEGLCREDVDCLRAANPEARFVVYLWDSLVRHENRRMLLENFPVIWSFDRKDCEQYPQLKFRPLFFRDIPPAASKEYVLTFVGWMHSDRLQIVRKLAAQLKKEGKPYFFKLYIGKFSLWINRHLTKNIRSSDRELLITEPIGYADYQQAVARSYAVLDIAHPLQSGLTMRTIETLAAGCHIYTTNADIANYPQINPESYTVIERQATDTLPVTGTACRQPDSFYSYFSLDGFITQLFS
ncbi:MAG: hypothetical protein LIP00_09730 [Parabacteroides sp.]|nr:hypothetical protein [Parabacteroides sp.]